MKYYKPNGFHGADECMMVGEPFLLKNIMTQAYCYPNKMMKWDNVNTFRTSK